MIDIQKIKKQSGIIGSSDEIAQVLEMICQVAPVDISVLISGESGAGKEIVAKAIHKTSKRSNQSLVVVNCGAIPEGIIESELFGHKKGSFTGAGNDKKGYFEEANKGTIFLDEIGETPLETQVKLLRVLEKIASTCGRLNPSIGLSLLTKTARASSEVRMGVGL